jgi:predicted secreted protein
MRLIANFNYRQLTFGDLNNYREAVKKYSIREVRLSPNGDYLVVLIDMTQPTYDGVLQSTFVQSFPLM